MTVAVHLVEHPLIADSLTRVRDKDTPNALFRQELERIGTLLIAEATRGLATHEVRVTTPLVTTSGRALSSQPVVVPVLRAGLGFVHAAQELIPSADARLLGQKIGMTSVYDANGRMRPVTVIAAGDNVLLRRFTAENDGYSAIKVGFGAQKESRVTKALLGEFKKVARSKRLMSEFPARG